jgi:DNA repair exonuclease SbcCD nuclease subunit
MRKDVVALASADCHFTLTPPASRAVEDDWLECQEVVINQVKDLQRECGMAPILLAGDILTDWNARPELLSFLIEKMKGMRVFTIPGNHDIPNHVYREIHRSGYWTLVKADVINHLVPGGTTSIGNCIISPFPYGFEVTPPNRSDKNDLCLNIALIHQYIWDEENKVEELATESSHVKSWRKKLKGYDVAVFGDNHKGFVSKKEGKCTIINCGSLQRISIDQDAYKPFVALIMLDGSVKRHYLECETDQFIHVNKKIDEMAITLDLDLSDLVKDYQNLHHGEKLQLAKIVMTWMAENEIPQRIQNLMLRALGVQIHE